MAKKTKKPEAKISKASAPPTIHKATLASDGSGAVEYGDEIDEPTAVSERLQGKDVVVRGEDQKANRVLARKIENQVGPNMPHFPHQKAGPHALPHFQQVTPPPVGHCFYETSKRTARKKK